MSIAGTLTYEDVTNVDSVGIITTRGGAHFNGGASLREKINIVANKVSAAPNINLDDGMVHYFTTTEEYYFHTKYKKFSGSQHCNGGW